MKYRPNELHFSDKVSEVVVTKFEVHSFRF
jgi:hypothetical protein